MPRFNLDKRTNLEPGTGKILISEPYISDPLFFRSIVLITAHDDEGTMGFILNHPPNKIPKILKSSTGDPILVNESSYKHITIGGPVAENEFFIIHDQGDLLGGQHIIEDIYLGISNNENLNGMEYDRFLEFHAPNARSKYFLGSAGWEKGQLLEEIKMGSWFVTEYSKDLVFSINYENLWKQAIYTLGKEFSYFSTLPIHPQLN
ncbi:MAG TPA: YqgE/AlgH family protein [Chitinophagaceae bacterium]|nr:YqgE/AlgH family protein [Chitinophagaceae bacterium]